MKKKAYYSPKVEAFLLSIEEGIAKGSQVELSGPIEVEDWEDEVDSKYFDFD